MSSSKKRDRAPAPESDEQEPDYLIGPVPDDIFGSADDPPEPHGPEAAHIAFDEKFYALVHNPDIYTCAREVFPPDEQPEPGRPGHFPPYVYMLFSASISVFRSARAAAANLQRPIWWDMLREGVREVLGDNEADALPAAGPQLHHWNYFFRNYYKPAIEAIRHSCSALWTQQAIDAGMLVGASGTWIRPARDHVIRGDVTVGAPPSLHTEAESPDKRTGEIRRHRVDPDAIVTTQGGGELVYGNSYLGMGVRKERTPHSRVILDACSVRKKSIELDPDNLAEGEAVVKMLKGILRRFDGRVAYVHDKALRGAHRSPLIHEGVVVYTPQAKGLEPQPLMRFQEPQCLHAHDLYAAGGRVCERILPVSGRKILYQPLPVRAVRPREGKGGWRFYHEVEVPCVAGTLHRKLIRVDETADDARPNAWGRKTLNRTEHLRIVPPGPSTGRRLGGHRQDAEAQHSTWDQCFPHKAVPAYGAVGGLVIYFGYVWVNNSVTRFYCGRTA